MFFNVIVQELIRESLAVKFEQHLLWRFSVCSLFSSDIWWWIPHCRCLCLLDRRVDVSIVTDDAVAVPSSASIHYHINQQAYCRHQIFICWILNNVASVPRALVYVAHEMRRWHGHLFHCSHRSDPVVLISWIQNGRGQIRFTPCANEAWQQENLRTAVVSIS